jgi:hypothetical protein
VVDFWTLLKFEKELLDDNYLREEMKLSEKVRKVVLAY